MALIFVYGTLKEGQPNYFRMLDGANGKAQFLSSARTTEKYPLVIASRYNIPYLLNLPGRGHQVRGEVYQVDEQMLGFLDAFEGVPAHYQRTLVDLEVQADCGGAEVAPGRSMQAFVYSTTTYQSDWLSLPTYESYDSSGAHGLEYVTREARD